MRAFLFAMQENRKFFVKSSKDIHVLSKNILCFSL